MVLFLEFFLNSGLEIWSKLLRNFYEISLFSRNSRISLRSEIFLENEILNLELSEIIIAIDGLKKEATYNESMAKLVAGLESRLGHRSAPAKATVSQWRN
jgi:hypothetical protein